MNTVKTFSFYVTLDWMFEFSENCNKINAYNYLINKLNYIDPANGWLRLLENIYNVENSKNYDGYVHSVIQKEQLSYDDWIENKENINPCNTLYITCYLLYDPIKYNLFDPNNGTLQEQQMEFMRKAIIQFIDKIKYIVDNEIHASMKITNLQIENYNLSKHHEMNNLTNSMYSTRLYEL